MGRQINISQRCPKIRGIKRRLNALDRWSHSFQGYFPSDAWDCSYWNWKIPILDILINPPTTTPKIQARCLASLIQAANHLIDARPSELSFARVAVLITYPYMFSSEICIFFDSDYFDSFFNRTDNYQSLSLLNNEQSLVRKLGVELPEIYEELAFEFKYNDEGLDGRTDYVEQWWSIREIKLQIN